MNTPYLSLALQDGPTSFAVPDSLRQKTVLYFMRAANCPQCNRHARDIEKFLPELTKRDMGAIIIVPENTEAAARVKERNHLTIPVMASKGDAHALAGLDKKLLGFIQQSGTIVVSEKGEVLYSHTATNPEKSFDTEDFQDYLASQPISVGEN